MPDAQDLVRVECPSRHRTDIVLDRPHKLNALTAGMLRGIANIACALHTDEDPRVVVLRSSETRAFCVGADLEEQAGLRTAEDAYRLSELGCLAFQALAQIPCPVIAQIDGHALGGGLELALACDLRVAGGTANMSFPETGLGNSPAWGGTARLATLVGPSRAMELILTGMSLDSASAERWGLLNRAVDGEAADAVDLLAGAIASRAPIAQRSAKRTVQAASPRPAPFFDASHAAFQITTADAREGKAAFADRKRSPEFIGK
ncbi:MAG: enoyl-CoA hydratase/isomerase family protein [Leucobacter sp.]